jgi:hypothetical protein
MQIDIFGASVHAGPAAVATVMKKVSGSEFVDVVFDAPAVVAAHQPTRLLNKPLELKLKEEQLVVECQYDNRKSKALEGGMGEEKELCFGVVTYSPPIDVVACTSLPSESTLESAFDLKLRSIEDIGSAKKRRRRRRKRQSDAMVNGFGDRLHTNAAGDEEKVKLHLKTLADGIYADMDGQGTSQKAEQER